MFIALILASQGACVMAPKKRAAATPKKAAPVKKHKGTAKKPASGKKEQPGPPSDKGHVRLDSPGFGTRVAEKVQEHDALKRKYMLTDAYHAQILVLYSAYKSRVADGSEEKEPQPHILPLPDIPQADSKIQSMLMSSWWETDGIILPTAVHFPQTLEVKGGDEGKENANSSKADVGLIRPVNVKQAEALCASFKDNGNLFDPMHPVGSSLRFCFVYFARRVTCFVANS